MKTISLNSSREILMRRPWKKSRALVFSLAMLAHYKYYSHLHSRPSAGVAQWQSSSFPSWLRGFDSLRPLHMRVSWLRGRMFPEPTLSLTRDGMHERVNLDSSFLFIGIDNNFNAQSAQGFIQCPLAPSFKLQNMVLVQIEALVNESVFVERATAADKRLSKTFPSSSIASRFFWNNSTFPLVTIC